MLYPNSATQSKEDIKKQFQSRLNRSGTSSIPSIFDNSAIQQNEVKSINNEENSKNETKPDKVVFFRNSNFTIKGCFTTLFLITLILVAFIYFLTTQIPSFKSQIDNLLNSQILPELNKKLSSINIPILKNITQASSSTSIATTQDNYLKSFLNKLSKLNGSLSQLETISFTQDEINAWLATQNFTLSNQKINSYVIIDPNNLKINLTSGSILPQVSLFIGVNSDKKLRLNGGSIGGTNLSIADFRDKLATLPLGIGNYNFDKLDEHFNSLLFNNNWKISTVVLKNQEVELVVIK